MIPTAVLVTRGDVDLQPIKDSLPADWPVQVWDNSEHVDDWKVYGHFRALEWCDNEWVYFQDDDAICPAAELLAAWDEAEHRHKVLTNVPHGDTWWISWGAIAHQDTIRAGLKPYYDVYGIDEDMLLWCDLILQEFAEMAVVNLGVSHLPQYRAENRMVMQPGHYEAQARVRAKCAELKVAA